MGSEFLKWIKVHVLSSFACNGKVGLVTQQESETSDGCCIFPKSR